MAKTVVELARQILEDATKYESLLAANGLPAPSLGPEAFPESELPAEAQAVRDSIFASTWDMTALIRGPSNVVRDTATYHPHFMALQAIYRYNLVSHVPAQGSVSYEVLAAKCRLRTSEVKRLLRYAMGNHLFYEPTPEHVAHNGASKALAETHTLKQWFGMIVEELWPASARAVDAMQKWPGSDEKNETGFQLAHGTDKPLFVEVTSNPQRAKRFAEAMSTFSTAPGFEVSHIVDTFPWAGLNGGSFTLVDVGGSLGTVDIALARAFPKAKFIVQDLPFMIAKAQVPEDLTGRLSFIEHDFFTPQTTAADVFFFRWIFHDWADSYCVKILRALIPAMRPGVRIIANEFCLPQPGEASAYHQRIMRSFDLTMLSIQNSKERELGDWKELFGLADPRFKFKNVHIPPGSPMVLIEFVWSEEIPAK